MKIFAVFSSLYLLLAATNALICWECENARGDKDCKKRGKATLCQLNQDACQVEIRHHEGWGYGPLITKRCKQAHACNNNFKQNPRPAWNPTQCNPRFPTNSVCRCCCGTDRCNYNALKCWDTTAACDPRPYAPKFGTVSCSRGKTVGSTCSFQCNQGYGMVGESSTVCTDKLTWSNPSPTCQPITCSPPHVSPANGKVVCSDENNLHSQCRFSCNPGFELKGAGVSLCQAGETGTGNGKWSHPSPTCIRAACPAKPSAPIHGGIVCTKGNSLGSVCEFVCNPHYRRVGPLKSKCVEMDEGTLDWDRPTPTCAPIKCENQGQLPHGRMNCSKSNFATSTCKFECLDEDYSLYPPQAVENSCQNNTVWSVPKPCCARPCPPYALMDLVIVLDSSSSIGAENWVTMVDFLKIFLSQYRVAPDATNFGIFRYNGVVDTDTQILLKDFPDSLESVIEAVGQIPYDGSGTKTGNALEHALKVMFAPENGNRAKIMDYVLVITDGKSQDPVKDVSERLREAGVRTYVMPVTPPRGKLDMDQVMDMAGRNENVIRGALASGFQALTAEFTEDLAKIVCGNPCDHVIHEHL